MIARYLQLKAESELPDISALSPFRAVIVIDEIVTSEWQTRVSNWLVKSGCLYMMAWGIDSSTWDNSVDIANLQEFDYEDIPEDKFVMTTWHEEESLREVFWFSKNNAFHPTVHLSNTLILHVSSKNKEKDFLSKYADA